MSAIVLKKLSREDRKMVNSIFLRSYLHNMGYSGAAKFCASGYLISQMPAINKYYADDPQGRIEAMQRHSTWYNATNIMNPLVMTITSLMEKEHAENPDFDPGTISAFKASMMGPISGIGDALAWGVFLCIAQAIAISMASTGSIIAPIAFLVIYNIPCQLIRYGMAYLGWSVGTNFISTVYESGLMQVVTKACGVLGLMMVGCMTASNVTFETTLSVTVEGTALPFQTYIDDIMPGLIPLLFTLLCLRLLQKGTSATKLIFGIYILSIVLALLHIC